MVGRNEHTTAHPFLYVGLLLLAIAVVIGLFAENPNASAMTVLSLGVMSNISVVCGLTALVIAPICTVKRSRR